MDKQKLILISFLIFVIIVMIVYIILNRDVIFKHEIKISYSDGCEEIYINGNLVTLECTNGRLIAEEAEKVKEFILPEWKNLSIH